MKTMKLVQFCLKIKNNKNTDKSISNNMINYCWLKILILNKFISTAITYLVDSAIKINKGRFYKSIY